MFEYIEKIIDEKLCSLREGFTHWYNRKNGPQIKIYGRLIRELELAKAKLKEDDGVEIARGKVEIERFCSGVVNVIIGKTMLANMEDEFEKLEGKTIILTAKILKDKDRIIGILHENIMGCGFGTMTIDSIKMVFDEIADEIINPGKE
jgi:hypothetical protein